MTPIEDITEALWGSRVSASTVSELNQKIYGQIELWRTGAYANIYDSPKLVSHAPLLGADGQVRVVTGEENWSIVYDPTVAEPPPLWSAPASGK